MHKLIVVCLMMAVVLAGCQSFSETVIPVAPQAPQPAAAAAEPQPSQSTESLQRRFSENPADKMDAMQSIANWSQRYDDLSQKTEQLREANSRLTLDNAKLQQEVEKLKTELAQARKDIEQANSLLQEAHLELSKWKADVLGFRDEIRQAQSAQLSALTKILRILGAETPSQSGTAAQEVKP